MSKLWSLGDSLSAGYPGNENINSALYGTHPGGQGDALGLKAWYLLKPKYPTVQVAAGIGYTIVSDVGGAGNIQTLEASPVLALGDSSDAVVIQGGTNDLAYGQTDTAVIAAIKTRASALMAKPFAQVVLWTVPPHGGFALAGQVEEPRVTAHGSGYTSRPTVTITGSGTGASAVAVLLGDQVLRIALLAGGSGYSGSVTVTLSGGGGSGATGVSQVSDGGYTGGYADGTWTAGKEAYRQSVNQWIRSSAVAQGYAHTVYDPEAMGFTDPTGSLWVDDQVHYSESGVTLHAQNIAGLLGYLLLPGTATIGSGTSVRRGGRP